MVFTYVSHSAALVYTCLVELFMKVLGAAVGPAPTTAKDDDISTCKRQVFRCWDYGLIGTFILRNQYIGLQVISKKYNIYRLDLTGRSKLSEKISR